ncbi:hypothetical protein FOXG_18842 [Fusarium oxysporum f. sp. lycopersici 4287]|uniref:Uncharacterized protein n=2 Tax=Fusarium oxysporum TaxID=5507 RepID=A0A0J9USL3_FUSO4|nr:hypothetical protein FOXG_18842 [Fusarium oxysporum f. sp. lycopersici 4287]EXK43691.1 hypothetical protein FOMG_02624 [Fusarium oxysporum f. sp. melonis 26406]KNB01221.1 hypothetical protein FOXG_18842 [Fusarium oxysporum f. sp. lycopersici 4287]
MSKLAILITISLKPAQAYILFITAHRYSISRWRGVPVQGTRSPS